LVRFPEKEDYQLFLCNSGAEANENALKLASFYNGRKKIIAFKKAFHGRTSLAVAATDNPAIVAPVNETDNVIFLPFNDEAALQKAFEENEICAVIIEGIQGVGGINIATEEFLQAIRRLCDQHNAVYIADSVQCGYGRSGKFYSHDFAGVDADIYTMAKGMGNGFPVAGISISPKVSCKTFYAWNNIWRQSSCMRSSIGCA
jgi:acetylornithine/N-succinyldiaminopimelate aminotransferase